MSREPNPIMSDVDDDRLDQPVGAMRLLPSISFGVRAAALSRVALPVAMIAAAVVAGDPATGQQNLVTMDTSCCPPDPS